MAHELKTPIFNVQGYISTLLDGGLEDELINRKYLERAEKSIDRLINIVNDLDTISKLESSMNRLDMERFDIVALAKEIADQAEMEADRKGIKISVKGADNLPSPFWVLADKHYIGQVLVNLIINSIHYGKEGGQTRIRFRDMLDKILIEVEDNGRASPRRTSRVCSNVSTVRTRGGRASRAARDSAWRSSSISSRRTASGSPCAANWAWAAPSPSRSRRSICRTSGNPSAGKPGAEHGFRSRALRRRVTH